MHFYFSFSFPGVYNKKEHEEILFDFGFFNLLGCLLVFMRIFTSLLSYY